VEDGNHDPSRAGKPFLLDEEKGHPAEPLALLTADQRRTVFVKRFGRFDRKALGIAVGNPVTASASLEAYPAGLAVDGVADNLASSWQTDPYPTWLKIDLEKPKKINRVHVFPYWGGQRYCRYSVEVSEDGKAWRQVVDMTRNNAPATPRGDDHRFEAITARYVRVNMLHHNLNSGVHLVEVRVFDTL